MLFAELRFFFELEFSHLGWFEQRDDQTETGCLPRDDLGPKILTAPRTRHECESMRLDPRYPVQRRLKHSEGI